MTEFHRLLTIIPIARCDLDSPFQVTIINTDKSNRTKSSSSLNGSSFLSLGTCRTSPQWNCLQIKNSSLVSKNVLDNFCQTGTNEISTFRGCLQLTAFPFRSQDCEEILPGCNFHPSGSFYRALHLSEFCSVLFSATSFIVESILHFLLPQVQSSECCTITGVDDDCYRK